MTVFKREVEIDCSQEELFAWHERPGAFKRLCPHWEKVNVVEHIGGIQDGAKVHVTINQGPVKLHWHLEHKNYILGERFEDHQQEGFLKGPFASWKHDHLFSSTGVKSLLLDDIQYKMPLGILGSVFGEGFSQAKLKRLFNYRHTITKNDLEILKGNKTMKIAITGASGMVGTELTNFLELGGHTVLKLVRSRDPLAEDEIYWNPVANEIEANKLEGLDAVIHLAGENIAAKRWSKDQKSKIMQSRVDGTDLLARTLAKLENKPKAFISASAIGFYGNRPDESLDENSEIGEGFLAETCKLWEKAADPAREAGIRVVHPRIGVVLSPKGGALAKMYPLFFIGGGGILGSGKQMMSWIALDDLVYGLFHCAKEESISGPVNMTAPHPVSNKEFTNTLAKVMFRPAIFPAPAFALKLALGEMAEALLLEGSEIKPEALLASSYDFKFPDLESALRHLLGK